MLTTQPGTDSFPLTRSEMTCFAGSLTLLWKSWTTLPLPRSSIVPLRTVLPRYFVSSCVSRSPLWVAHSSWTWLWPSPHRDCPPPLSSSSPQHSSPKFNYKKARWDVYQSYIVEQLSSVDVDAVTIHQAARSFSLFLVETAKASIPFGRLGRSPKAWWSQERESAVRERRRARSEAHRSEAHRLRYIDASRRASSVISRAKSATWPAICSNLAPPFWSSCCLQASQCHFGQKEHLPRPFFSRLHFPSWHCQSLRLLSSLTSISSNTPFLAQSQTTVHEWTPES